MKKSLLAYSIAAATFVGASATQAATITFVSDDLLYTTQSVTAGQKVRGAADGTFTIPAIAGTAGVETGDKIIITLQGGAKFDATAANTLELATGIISGGVFNAKNVAFAGNGTLSANGTVFTKTLNATDIDSTTVGAQTSSDVNQAVVFTVDWDGNADLLDLSGVTAGTDVTYKVEIERDLLGNPSIVHTGTTDGTSATERLVDVAGSLIVRSTAGTLAPELVTIDVATGYQLFTTATATSTTSETTNADVFASSDAQQAGSATGNFLVTIAGPMAGVVSITESGAIISQSTATAGTAPTTPTAAGDFFIDKTNNVAYGSFTGVQLTPDLGSLVFAIDGTTQLADSDFTIAVDYQAGAADVYASHSVRSATSLTEWDRDGTFFTMDSFGTLNKLKITDVSGTLDATNGGSIRWTAYDAAGAMVSAAAGAPALVGAVPNNGTITQQGADVLANFPTGVRFDVVVESSDAVVSNVKKNSDGISVTTFRSSNGNGGTL